MNKMPTNAMQVRQLLTRYLSQCQPYITNQKDKVWVQAEADRYNGQMQMITEGVKRKGGVKQTGIVRAVDDLGRYVIPMELRRTYDIKSGDSMEFFIDTDRGMIVMQKYEPACNFCGENTEDITRFRGKRICETCLEELYNGNN